MEKKQIKICSKCKRELPVSCFSARTRNRATFESFCKECKATAQRERTKKYSAQRIAERKEYKREWSKRNKHKVEEHERKQREAGHREAHRVVTRFRKRHKGIFKVCSICETEGRVLAHHPNYNEPTKVIIVCDSCHQGIHRGRIKEDKGLVIDILELDCQAKAKSHRARVLR